MRACAFAEVHWVAPGEAVWACRRLAATHASGGRSVGTVALVDGWLARTGEPDTRIVAIFPGRPHRYFDTVYNGEYCRDHGLLDGPILLVPDAIDSPTERVVTRWTRCTAVSAPKEALR